MSKLTSGFSLLCPECGASPDDARLRVYLEDFNTITCESCDAEFTIDYAVQKAVENLKQWQAVQAIVAKAKELASAI